MENISASKIVFILVALSASITYVYSVIAGLITIDPKDFIALAIMAFGFYFGTKTDSTPLGGIK
jgi:hypothetical protein